MGVGAAGGQERELELELEFQAGVSSPVWVLGTRARGALTSRVASPALYSFLPNSYHSHSVEMDPASPSGKCAVRAWLEPAGTLCMSMGKPSGGRLL